MVLRFSLWVPVPVSTKYYYMKGTNIKTNLKTEGRIQNVKYIAIFQKEATTYIYRNESKHQNLCLMYIFKECNYFVCRYFEEDLRLST